MIFSPMFVGVLAILVAAIGCGRGDSSNSMQPIPTESAVADIAESSDSEASPVNEPAAPDVTTLPSADTVPDSADVVEVVDHPPAEESDSLAEEPDSLESGQDSDPIAEVPSPPSVEPAGGAPFRILLPTTEGMLLVDVEIRIGEMPLAQAFAKRIAAVIAEASGKEEASGPTWQELFAHVQADPEQFGRGQPINAEQYDEAIRRYDLNRNRRPDDDEVARFLFRDAGTDEPFRLIGTDHYRHANRSDSALFRAIDSDGDGQLESGELDQSANSLMRLDQNADRGITLNEASVNEPNDGPAWGRRRTHRRGTVAMDLGGYVDWTMVSYAMDGWMQRFPFGVEASAIAAIDHDGDGAISSEEAESLREVAPDLRLRVQFAENRLGEAMIEVVSMRPNLESMTRIEQSAGSITVWGRSLRFRFEILDSPSRQNRVPPEAFAMLDSDGDGFLQPSEIPESVPSDFSVESLDADGDGKLSLSEINRGMIRKSPIWATQVRGRAAEFPDAVFAWLDSNQDRFLSEREILAAGDRLSKDARLPLKPADIADSFVVQIARGDPGQDNQTFRFANRGGPQSDSLPPWARHMDSNGDGDISELEFIGTSDQFDDFDRNGDGFIDSLEVAGG
jgi:Ca2+-binding EF-hand superfamily protein